MTELRSRGIQPDAIVCRSDRPIPYRLKEKISALCDVPVSGIVSAVDASSLYEIPLVLHEEGFDDYVCKALQLEEREADLTEWKELVRHVPAVDSTVRIGIVGKYVQLQDAYLSVVEAVRHGGFACGADIAFDWIASDEAEGLLAQGRLKDLDGIVVPGGFAYAASRARSPRSPTHESRVCRSSACASVCIVRSSSTAQRVRARGRQLE